MMLILKIYFSPTQLIENAIFAILNLKKKEVKKSMFLFHYGQMGSNKDAGQLALNVLKRGPITYYLITYEQHRNFYGFFSEQIVEEFF